ncbi:hypothetical protein ATANTOWER_001901 [Ataeniobius toweri]|uniref:Uncharacterized protein n=1 Tax=Ataeniobius toweri TaxID=208326 RepID=A0ABU7AB26_9TELE|nr:hypothetical protein [Ataeniobius toweri]
MIKPTYVSWIRKILPPVFVWIHIKLAASCSLRLLNQAIRVPCPPSNVSHHTLNSFLLFRAHTEQHQENSLRISLQKSWILNLIPPDDLTTITHEIFVLFVPDSIISKTVFILLPSSECSLYVGQCHFENNNTNRAGTLNKHPDLL